MKRSFELVGDQPVDVPALGRVVAPGDVVEADGGVADGLEGQSKWKPVRAAKKTAGNRDDSQEG